MGFADSMLQTESTRAVCLSNCDSSEERSGRLSMENHRAALPKCKHRGVWAVRDFPPGCGRSASGILRPNGEAVGFAIVDSTAGHVEEAVNNMIEPAEGLGHETVSVSKDISNENAIAPAGKLVLRKYPPRKSISAVRDFPPSCGRNAPYLSKEEHEVLFSMEKSGTKGMPMEETTLGKKIRVGDLDGDACKSRLQRDLPRSNGDKVQSEANGPSTKGEVTQEEFGASKNGIKVTSEGIQERDSELFVEYVHSQQDQKSDSIPKSVNLGLIASDDLGEDFTAHKISKRKLSYVSGSEHQSVQVGLASNSTVVIGLMAKEKCPWRQGVNKLDKLAPSRVQRKWRENDFKLVPRSKSDLSLQKHEAENSGEAHVKNNSFNSQGACMGTSQMVELDMEDPLDHVEVVDDFRFVKRSHNIEVCVPPTVPASSSGKIVGDAAVVSRIKVRETMRLFQAMCRKLLQEEEAKSGERRGSRRIDLEAAKALKNQGKYINVGKQIVGPVPGVEVGDEFQYRVELNIVGLHRQIQGGIDYVKQGSKIIATSIVSSGGYDDDTENSNILIYTGSGGNMMNTDKEPEDQKLERGNLALKNSVDVKNPVRVIRGDNKDSSDARGRIYIYDGLYLVEKYWQEMGSHGKLVFKFKLVRNPGQPELAWKVVTKSKKSKVREGVCMDDISQGKEKRPICAVNTIDNEKPPSFTYVTHMIYSDRCSPVPPKGCGCTYGCSDAGKCSCIAKNGGEIPYNYNGALVEIKTLVYECGPSCRCPPSCYNRVTQHGIRFQLEIFKTGSRGWGVRSLNSIPSGSFICEYVGELLEEKEAEQRTGNDDYLFDIGDQYSDNSHRDGALTVVHDAQPSSSEVVGNGGFTIDAAQYGNVGRFINHSCSPNLYAQNVLYDHGDQRIPHVMFFAVENIAPLQELTYHYNYLVDQVYDSNGNIRKKSCYCGSPECTGRMY